MPTTINGGLIRHWFSHWHCTSLIEHHFEIHPGAIVGSQPYRLPEHRRQIVRRGLAEIMKMGVLEESHSTWYSLWCRKMVMLTTARGMKCQFDAYPMPQVDELIDRLGTAQCKENGLLHSVLYVPICHTAVWLVQSHSYIAALYGRHHPQTHLGGACVLGGHGPEVPEAGGAPEEACGWTEGDIVSGTPLGRWAGAPTDGRDSSCHILPKTRKEVRRFLGLAGYYWWFVPSFVELTSPLTDLP